MFRIIFSNGFWEEIAVAALGGVDVRGWTVDHHEAFHFEAGFQDAPARTAAIEDQIRTKGSDFTVESRPEEPVFMIPGPAGGKARAVAASDLGSLDKLKEALLALDKGARLAPASIQRWIQAAEALHAAARWPTAFECSGVALERGRLPHIRLPIKDDTSQRVMAAQVTFEDGRQEEASAMMLRLAKNYLNLLEEAWK